MKRIVALLSALLIFVAALTSCSNEDNVYAEFETNPEAEVVLIGPSGNKSFLAYYNADLTELLSVTKIDFPRLGGISTPCVYTDDKAYVIAEKEENKYTDTLDEVIVLDFKTGEAKKLPLSATAIFDMYAMGNAVYTYYGILNRYDVETGEKLEFVSEDIEIKDVYACGDTVYIVASDFHKDTYATLYLLDEKTLTVKKTYDVLDYCFSVNDMIEVDGKLYIAPTTILNAGLMEEDAEDLVCLDLETGEIEIIDIDSPYECVEVLQYKDELIIANSQTRSNEGQDLTRYNLTTKEIKTEKLDAQTYHMQIKGDYLYQYSIDKIAVYDLSKPQLTKVNEIEAKVDDAYISDFFVF